jgi:hypothetical protein
VTKYWTKAPSFAGLPEKNVPEVWRSSYSRLSTAAPSGSQPTCPNTQTNERQEGTACPSPREANSIQQKQGAFTKRKEWQTGLDSEWLRGFACAIESWGKLGFTVLLEAATGSGDLRRTSVFIG